MTIILVIAAVCVYDLCGLLAVLYINHTDRMDTVDGAQTTLLSLFSGHCWSLPASALRFIV
uniref:Uncharacterized protein n=1 Tax=Ackermannviridae sp. TaxID=2831612 RepID=A0A8S5VKN1_9CAUD|nr:MAG TPA: hypothetical protein [Ackermannviridae sp.]